MTIVFQGHINKVELGNGLDVHIVTPQKECGQEVIIHVPRSEATHWLPGAAVQFTIYALPLVNAPETEQS